ncbi:MAG: hypothetical protein FWG90_10095 [Oscillospiraceae bacterium]|nr:hypothetical protein [Oscillospiraceae bacterium]
MNTIKCTICGSELEIEKALEQQVESRMLAEYHQWHQQEIARARADEQAIAKAFIDEQIRFQIAQTEQIREDVRKQADEAQRYKELELQKQLNDTKKCWMPL